MRIDSKVAAKFGVLTERFAALPGVTVKNVSPLTATLAISGHFPLDTVELTYICRNRFWTKDFDPVFTAETAAGGSGVLRLRYGREGVRFEGDPALADLAGRLADNRLLRDRLAQQDITALTVTISDGRARVALRPLCGAAVRMLFPPLTYLIQPTAQECAVLLQIVQLVLSIIGESSR